MTVLLLEFLLSQLVGLPPPPCPIPPGPLVRQLPLAMVAAICWSEAVDVRIQLGGQAFADLVWRNLPQLCVLDSVSLPVFSPGFGHWVEAGAWAHIRVPSQSLGFRLSPRALGCTAGALWPCPPVSALGGYPPSVHGDSYPHSVVHKGHFPTWGAMYVAPCVWVMLQV